MRAIHEKSRQRKTRTYFPSAKCSVRGYLNTVGMCVGIPGSNLKLSIYNISSSEKYISRKCDFEKCLNAVASP